MMNEERPQSDERPPLWDDPVIEEVRAIRRRLWEASGHDIHRFIEQTRRAADSRKGDGPNRKRNAG